MANPSTSYAGAPPGAVGAPAIIGQSTDMQTGGGIPFRRATVPRTDKLQVISGINVSAAIQRFDQSVDGSGYLAAIDIDVQVTTAANVAVVTYLEDAPYNILNSVVLRDVNGELINITGYHLYLANLYFGYTPSLNRTASLDTSVYSLIAGAAAGVGGSFRFHLYAPAIINRRNLIGLVGNQDRAQRYSLRTDLDTTATIYGVPPTAPGAITLVKTYENYAVPPAVNQFNVPQQQFPDAFGALHFITQTVSESVPIGGSTVNHYLKRVGNTIRAIVLVFRSNGTRAAAETNFPIGVQMKIGDTTIFNETPAYRRRVMFDRYGFDAPAGVLTYDWITDILMRAGSEFGDDWVWSQSVVNFQFLISYPAGFGVANNSLTFLTSDLIIPPNVDPYTAQ